MRILAKIFNAIYCWLFGIPKQHNNSDKLTWVDTVSEFDQLLFEGEQYTSPDNIERLEKADFEENGIGDVDFYMEIQIVRNGLSYAEEMVARKMIEKSLDAIVVRWLDGETLGAHEILTIKGIERGLNEENKL